MKKILIIEDDTIISTIYTNKFRMEGYEVQSVPDGASGIQKVSEFKPNVVILDLMGPALDGVDVISKIRSLPGSNHVPIIVFSNAYRPQKVQDAWKAGANYCLIKANTSAKELVATVAKAVAPAAVSEAASPTLPGSKSSRREAKGPLASDSVDQPLSANESSDHDFLKDLQASILQTLPDTLTVIRSQLQALNKAVEPAERSAVIFEMYRKIHALSTNAAMAGLQLAARLASALEAFLQELHKKPEHINPSVLRTVAQTVDSLSSIFGRNENRFDIPVENATLLVVDDDLISRRAVVFALEKVSFKPISLEDPVAALSMLEQKPFDLVFLDIDMPGMSGLELCKKIKSLPLHKQTPVIFISSLSDFQSRAQSALSGGADLIGKPFLFLELALKALLHIIRVRLAQPNLPSPKG